MSKEKQIDENEQIKEMAEDLMICHVEFGEDDDIRTDYEVTAAMMYKNRGYRKQIEGEWIYEWSGDCLDGTDASLDYKCSLCCELATNPFSYCPNCGAKMKGGAE